MYDESKELTLRVHDECTSISPSFTLRVLISSRPLLQMFPLLPSIASSTDQRNINQSPYEHHRSLNSSYHPLSLRIHQRTVNHLTLTITHSPHSLTPLTLPASTSHHHSLPSLAHQPSNHSLTPSLTPSLTHPPHLTSLTPITSLTSLTSPNSTHKKTGNGSDVFGSDICTCKPYLTFAIEECIKTAQRGGVGVVVYFRKEGRALGEVTKWVFYLSFHH